jgi:hypothetical protein
MSLHTKLSPLILDTPFHHCVFCLLQDNPWVLLGFTSLMIGICISISSGLIGYLQGPAHFADRMLCKMKIIIFGLYGAGVAGIGIPTLLSAYA